MRIAFTRGWALFALALTLTPFGALPAADAVFGDPARAAAARLRAAGAPSVLPVTTSEAVPDQIEDYVETALLPRLADLYAPSADGDVGIRFDETTTFGSLTRVWAWTDDFLSGGDRNDPAHLTNDWVLPISVAEQPVGVATVWINPVTDGAELATFDPEAHIVAALAAAPEGSLLVRDADNGAWFALFGETVTPLAAASSLPGLMMGRGSGLDEAQAAIIAASGRQPPAPVATNDGVLFAAATLLIAVLASAVVLLVPGRARVFAEAGGSDGPDGDGVARAAKWADADRTRAEYAADTRARAHARLSAGPEAPVDESVPVRR